MSCFITRTGSFLPGAPISNNELQQYIGKLIGESKIKDKILKVNGIKSRHYALDKKQNPTHNIYELAKEAVADCLSDYQLEQGPSYLAAGSTNAPLIGPGLSSILHNYMKDEGLVDYPLEINSNSGICSSSAQAFVNAYRSILTKDHRSALCVGVEQPSDILKSKSIRPTYDIVNIVRDVRSSAWFMSVFLRFMLSDGAGAFLLEDKPASDGVSLSVDWTYSQSFANEAPLCMKLDNRRLLLSQDVNILTQYMIPCVRKVMSGAMSKYNERLENYRVLLPHISSYYFRRYMLDVTREFLGNPEDKVDYWTNLATAGNTGAASIFIMLDEYLKTHEISDGDRLLLFIPESGQFNFVLISLTAVVR